MAPEHDAAPEEAYSSGTAQSNDADTESLDTGRSFTVDLDAAGAMIDRIPEVIHRLPELLAAFDRMDAGPVVVTVTSPPAPCPAELRNDDAYDDGFPEDALREPPKCPRAGAFGHDGRQCVACTTRAEWVRDDVRKQMKARQLAASGLPTAAELMLPGGSLILDQPESPVPIWGTGDRVLMAEGESLVLLGAAGLGKTTLAQQWAFGRCGVPGFARLLDLPVTPGHRRVLYLAMDRPRQALRSMRRMIGPDVRDLLDERLVVWMGPPPVNLVQNPDALARLCAEAGADSVVVDSLKDAGSVIDDEGGTGWNTARQTALVAGIAILELHHPRKLPAGTIPGLDDAYGSTWITAGAGSVLGIGGAAGDSIVDLRHLKQPAEDLGTFKVLHDHAHGRSTIWDTADLVALAARPEGVTAVEAARAMFDQDKPDANQKAKARRKLEALVKAGDLALSEPGDRAANRPARWGVAAR
ncbi:AAA family ATPase [Raineyella sp. LH-20]|uniref:AAA family ATPase n=1 Tax=Raineyella sp. LH-20 TaxID=3081204 RepID=UPI0029538B71|nr:AAA family ATPase [Raineyella sp. LH-20]WOP17406.1 AAA family ATPase [Raineyella sp. LH-20]